MKNRNVIVGIFVTAGLTLFTIGLFLIGNRHEAFARHIEYYAEFTNLSGITKGAKVQVAGMAAGQVVDIGVPNSPASRFRVRVRISEALHGLVRTDSVATIGTEGVVGDTFLLIHPGSANAPAADAQATLMSKEPTELSELLDEGKGVLANVDSTVKNANGVLTTVGKNLNSTLDEAKTAVGNANDVVVSIKQGRGPVGMMLRDETVATQLRQTVSNAQQATVDLDHASSQANALVSDIQSRQLPQKVESVLVSVKSAASNLDASSNQIRQTISEAAGPDAQGVTAGMNISQSLTNANYATANMADDTEALKHNFFFRNFFHNRGYYNLTNISPDKYEKDPLFTSPSNARVWLPADQVFEHSSDGVEHLTAQGKSLLDGGIGSRGDSIAVSPIVVEGYSGEADAAEQLARSRARAILVRNYLRNRFQLDGSHLGLVAMKNVPPSGLDHATWDGVCVVIVVPKK
jgi:phospholipid/cholesterol/gamma-HCH transport system substrate-binding protein